MNGRPASLLLVDDEEMNRDMLGRRLELHGYQVTQAEDGRQALRLIEHHDFDLILLDVMMPELNGLEVLQQLRRVYEPVDLPVILVTARGQSAEIVEAFKLGANDYVTKPIDMPVTLARIATHVAHRRTLEALRESQTRYALAERGTNDGLWDWDLRTEEIYFSPRWKEMLGFDECEVGNSPREWLMRVHPEDLVRVEAELSAHRQGLTRHFESEHRMLHRDQSYRWVLCRGLAIRDSKGTELRMAGSQTDVTEAKVADPLTGLPNRVLFLDRVGRTIIRAKRHPEYRLAVLFLDLDRFKVVNDSLGHQFGDQLLIALARRLEACVRSTDSISRLGGGFTVARLGGDEFTILLDETKEVGDAAIVAERILAELSAPFLIGGREVYTSASIGVVTGGAEYERAEELLRDADTAMYSAKTKGKSRFVVFDETMRVQAVARLKLETDLRRALERHEFRLHYQPILTLETNQVIGFEALVRWQHPERGLLMPADFLAVAEETWLIVPLGWWVIREACHQMRVWQDTFSLGSPLLMCVNLSTRQILQSDFVAVVLELLREYDVDPRGLKLEVTESTIMDHPESTAEMLAQLREHGIQVGVDDFGTGYSSLSYLHQFPIDTVKINRSFVRDMDKPDRQEIIQAIVTLAHNLDLDVIAEGVETASQRGGLQALQCKFGQGYFFSKPLDGEAASMLIANEARRAMAADRSSSRQSQGDSKSGEPLELSQLP